MSIFGKLKSLKNSITGGAAHVSIKTAPLVFGEPFEVTVKATTSDTDVKIDRVYIELMGIEKITGTCSCKSNGSSYTGTVSDRYISHSQKLDVSDAQVLAANETYEWQTQVTIPESCLPVFKGKHCQHFYEIRASLDCFGNDPDSGWNEIHED